VIVLDGDGSLLMNLGSLATIGLLQPANLVLVVMDNEQFATTGGQPTPTAQGADLEAAARSMRIAHTTTVRDAATLSAALERAAGLGQVAIGLRSGPLQSVALRPGPDPTSGPAVIVAKVAESAPTVRPPNDCVAMKDRFMTALTRP
jgi:TPP-dependent indolepyruvate ferredoxin oxidoreductase alpha subunit